MSRVVSHLLNEPTIPVYPTLAKLIGINQAVILQQLHFLLNVTKNAQHNYNHVDGRWWVYNSYEQWRDDHFIWLSAASIKRFFLEMEKDGYIISRQGVKASHDRKKWYSIDYVRWEKYVKERSKSSDAPDQIDPMDEIKLIPSNRSKRSDEVLTETTTETTSKIKEKEAPLVASVPVQELTPAEMKEQGALLFQEVLHKLNGNMGSTRKTDAQIAAEIAIAEAKYPSKGKTHVSR